MNKNATKKILESKSIIAISNLIQNEQIEKFSEKYDCIIRFNHMSNEITLQNFPFYNGKTDICVLSGWKLSLYGNLDGYKNKTVLFSRPKYHNNLKYMYKHIGVKPCVEDEILKQTTNIEYIPEKIFYNFYDLFKYDHPTTGLITLFYIKKYLNKSIETINYLIKDTRVVGHNFDLEKQIFLSLNINNLKLI